MVLPKSEYVSNVWRDGIFGKEASHDFEMITDPEQPERLSSAPAAQARFALHR